MDEREEILTIVFSILAFLSLISIIIVCICCLYRRHRHRRRGLSISHFREEYQRTKRMTRNNEVIENRRKRRKKRFNTNESAISFSFNPPHLINQNVKNLDQLLANESPERFSPNDPNRGYINPITDPVYTSSSSLITPLPNLSLTVANYSHPTSQQFNNLHFHYLNDLNHALCAKYEQRPSYGVKHSQSCRPSDYYRSMTPSVSSSTKSFFDPLFYGNAYKHSTLIHKAYIGHLRDDTAIFY